MELLDRLERAMRIGPTARQFAVRMAPVVGDEDPVTCAAAACVIEEFLRGRQAVAADALTDWLKACDVDVGDVAQRLRASGWVSAPEGAAPLVVDPFDFVLTHRFDRMLDALATAFRDRAATLPPLQDLVDRQQPIPRTPLLVVTGGPGTGKTTLVSRLLSDWLSEDATLRIALCAPSGKAASRMGDVMRRARSGSGPWGEREAAVRELLPREAFTVHRLLGMGWSGTPTYHRDNPLPYDVVVVDEASMLDVILLSQLVDALPDRGSLVLVGDQDQLDAVGPGSAFAALCRAAEPVSRAVVRLTRQWRFGAHSGIAALADAVRAGDVSRVVAVLSSSDYDDVTWEPAPQWPRVWEQAAARFARRTADFDPTSGADHFDDFRVLCTRNQGPGGQIACNETVVRAVGKGKERYCGLPVMVLQNDYRSGVFNGEVGVVVRTSPSVVVRFPGGEGGREVPFRALPSWTSAYALTIHKSQGSEFGHVWVCLSDADSPLLSRQLLYTAITRAQQSCRIFGSKEALMRCLQADGAAPSSFAHRLNAP